MSWKKTTKQVFDEDINPALKSAAVKIAEKYTTSPQGKRIIKKVKKDIIIPKVKEEAVIALNKWFFPLGVGIFILLLAKRKG